MSPVNPNAPFQNANSQNNSPRKAIRFENTESIQRLFEQFQRKSKAAQEEKASQLKAHFKDRYEKALPYPLNQDDAKLQQQIAKLPDPVKGRILKAAFPNASEDLKQADIAWNSKKPGTAHSLQDLIDYNNAQDAFQLATSFGNDIPTAERGQQLHDGLRLNTPRFFHKILGNNKNDFGPAIHHQDKQQFNLLSKAILTRHWGLASQLLKQGADFLQTDITGARPIDWAGLMGQEKLIEEMCAKLGDRLLPEERECLMKVAQAEGLHASEREELLDIAKKGRMNAEGTKCLENIAERFQKKAAKLKEGETRTAFEDLASQALFVAKRDDLSDMATATKLQHERVSQAAMQMDDSDLGFDFEQSIQQLDDPQLDEQYQQRIEQQFYHGMANLAAGKDFHPKHDYKDDSDPMSRFGDVMEKCSPNAHETILSAAHALIQSGVDPNQNSNFCSKPLWQNENPEILDALLDVGADLNKPPHEDADPLLVHHFPSWKHADMTLAKKLVEAGAKINVKGPHGEYPLLNASWQRSPEYAFYLLEKGAIPDLDAEVDQHRCKPLHWASIVSHQTELVEKLIKHGANINHQPIDAGLYTPLHFATQYSNMNNVKALLRNGADTEVQELRGKTPAKLAWDRLKGSMANAAEAQTTDALIAALRDMSILKAISCQKQIDRQKPAE